MKKIDIQIEDGVFSMFPDFCRGVIVARELDNRGEPPGLLEGLHEQVAKVRSDASLADYKSHRRIAPWRAAFEEFRMNPNQNPPSVAGLIKRIRNGHDLPFINKLVAIMNTVSLANIVPVGGDDLKSTAGHLSLTLASGDEQYRPLGKPERAEKPSPGEVIYQDTKRHEVLCRGWCWRNSHITRILPETEFVAINVDGLDPVAQTDVERIRNDLAAMVERYCGGILELYLLSKDHPEFVSNA
jgi:DNA/RNA-binding domain of Phe-tRNA-synthetase-like protein